MKLSIAFSPCPNDTFIFDALINRKIDMEGLEFEMYLGDVEELNRNAFLGRHDVTKLSFNAFTQVTKKYQLLNAGSALGRGCGPLLIARKSMNRIELETATIAIPGVNTTANFLLSMAYPNCINKKEMLFSDIERAVINGEVDAGLIIHENRFTYKDKGLIAIKDMGEYWEEAVNAPIPLGGIAIKRELTQEVKEKVDRLVEKSVSYAFANPSDSTNFVLTHAQEMDPDVVAAHIELYVNKFSLDLGHEGKKAIDKLMEVAVQNGMLSSVPANIYV